MADPAIDGQPAGAQEMQRAVDAGADPKAVQQWAAGEAHKAIEAGANAKDVYKHFGWDQEGPNLAPLQAHVEAGFNALAPEDHARVANGGLDALAAGFQTSVTSLIASGKPTIDMPKDPTFFQKLMNSTGQFIGDAPATIAGYVAGSVAGAAGGGAIGTAIGPEGTVGGAAAGTIMGGGAGSAAVPAAMRDALMQVYAKNPRATFSQVWSGLTDISWGQVAKSSAKAGLAGLVGGAAGGAAGARIVEGATPLLSQAAATVAGKTGELAAFTGAAATVGSALEGHLPTTDDILVGTILAAGAHMASSVASLKGATQRPVTTDLGDAVASNMRDAYVATGLKPSVLGKVATTDVGVKEELLAPTDQDGQRATPILDAIKLKEPEPYKTEAFHGSRHDITDFSTDKIGTGEGGQAYGHGLYFAQNPRVASYYKDAGLEAPAGPKPAFNFRGQEYNTVDQIASQFGKEGSDEYDAARAGANLVAMNSHDPNAARLSLEEMIKDDTEQAKEIRAGNRDDHFKGGADHLTQGMDPESEAYKAIMQPKRDREAAYYEGEVEHYKRTIDWLDANGQDLKAPEKPGNVYNVHLDAGIGHNLLNWDKPIEEQSDRVQNLFHNVKGLPPPKPGEPIGEWHDRIISEARGVPYDQEGNLVEREPKDVADKLSEAGIRGFHYLDRDSRVDGEGTHNMVIFDAKHITVTHKNGMPIDNPETFHSEADDRMLAAQGDTGEWEPPANALAGRGGEPPREPPARPALPGPDEPERAEFVKNNDYRLQVIGDAVGEKPGQPGFLARWGGSLRRFMGAFAAQLTPDRSLDRELGLLGEHTEEGQIKAPNQIGLEAMGRMAYGSAARTYYAFAHGPIEPTEFGFKRVAGPSVFSAFDMVKKAGGNSTDFWKYLMAGRTVEKAQQGIDTGIPLDVAAAHMADPENQRMYGPAAEAYREANQGMTHYYRMSGMLNDVRETAMNNLNQYYVTFNRIMDPQGRYGFGERAGGSRQVKKMEGSERQITDPAQATVANSHTLFAMADQNRRIGNLVGLVELKNATEKYGMTKVDPKEMGIDLDTEELLKGRLEDEDGNEITGPAKEGALPLLAYRAFNGVRGPGDFLYFRDGVPEIWRTTDQRVADIANMQTSNPKVGFSALRFGSELVRRGVTLLPSFWVGALSHAQFGAFTAGEQTQAPLVGLFRGMPQALREMTGADLSDQFHRFLMHGGSTALSDIDKVFHQGDLDYVMQKTGLASRVWNVARSPIEAMDRMQHLLHTAAQYGDFMHQENIGKPSLLAHNASATNTLDFREPMGNAWAQEFSRWVPFMNVAVKDIEQAGRAIQNNPGTFFAKGFAALTVPAVMLGVANALADRNLPDRDKSTNIPQAIRDSHFIFPPDSSGYRHMWKKPYVLNYLFTSLPERFIDHLAGAEPETMSQIGQQMMQSFLPPAMPALLAPAVEQATNTRLQSGTPLISQSMEGLTGYMRYGPNTSIAAQKISKFLASPQPYKPTIQLAPAVLDNYIKDLGGSMTYEMLHAINGSFRPPGTGNQGPLHDMWTKAFYLSHDDYTPQPMEDAWQVVTDFKQSHGDAVKALRDGNPDAVLSKDQVMAATRADKFEKALVGFNRRVNMINDATDMTLNEKSLAVDSLYSNYLPAIEQETKAFKAIQDRANGQH